MLTKSDKQFILKAVKDTSEKLKKELKKELVTKEEMAQHKDVIIERLDNIDQELAMTNGQRDILEDHEERISALEKAQSHARS